jgi:hypothetical protein
MKQLRRTLRAKPKAGVYKDDDLPGFYLKALGHPLPSQSANSGHYEFLDELDGAVSQARLWSSVIRTIARKLMVDGIVLPKDFDRMTQMGNASC